MLALSFPGPAEAPSEQVRRWVEEPVAFWEECARLFGPLVSLQLGSLGAILLVSSPEVVREIFRLPEESFECRQYNEHYRHVMGERSLLLLDGSEHARQKTALGARFQPAALAEEAPVLLALAEEMAASWPEGEAFSPRPSFHAFAFRVVLHLTLGSLQTTAADILQKRYLRNVLPQIGGSWGPWQQFRRLQPGIRELLAEEVAARRADHSIPGILTRLVSDADESGGGADLESLADHVFTFMIAGVDTTACALTWCLYWLTREPEVADGLARELAEVRAEELAEERAAGLAGDPAEPAAVDVGTLLRHPGLKAAFQETLRMVPIVPTPSGRRLTREVRLAGHAIPAGVTLVPCPYLLHRREELYPEGDRFRPARFLERRYAGHEYLPFGGGARRCLGEHLAEEDFKLALAAVLRHWTIESRTEGEVVPARHGILLAPSANFRIAVRRRAARAQGSGR